MKIQENHRNSLEKMHLSSDMKSDNMKLGKTIELKKMWDFRKRAENAKKTLSPEK